MLRVVDFFVVVITRSEHHDGCPGNDDRKHHFDPRAQRQQACTDGDEDAAENDGTDDAPVQNAVAQAIRNLEPGEQGHEHEQVVDAQHFFQRITGHEQRGNFGAMLYIQETGESQRNGDPENRPRRSLCEGDRLVSAMGKHIDSHGRNGQTDENRHREWREA